MTFSETDLSAKETSDINGRRKQIPAYLRKQGISTSDAA